MTSVVEMKCYDTTVLGKQKSDPWDYEKETRIMSVLSLPYNRNWEYLDFLPIVFPPIQKGDHLAALISLYIFQFVSLVLCEQIITHNNILYNSGIFAPLISISAD